MAKNYRLNTEKSYPDSLLFTKLHSAALKYDKYKDKTVLFIYRKSKKPDSEYYCCEVRFGKENFIHLVGFESSYRRKRKEHSRGVNSGNTIKRYFNAEDFYDACLKTDGLDTSYLLFAENRKAASSKLSVIEQLLEFKQVKIYQIGKKDVPTINNEFNIGIGTNGSIMGFDDIDINKTVKKPRTVMKRGLTEYVSQPMKLLLTMIKSKGERYYKTVEGTISSGVKYEDLPQFIQRKIDSFWESKVIK